MSTPTDYEIELLELFRVREAARQKIVAAKLRLSDVQRRLAHCLDSQTTCLQKLIDHFHNESNSGLQVAVERCAVLCDICEAADVLQELYIDKAAPPGTDRIPARQPVADAVIASGVLPELSTFCTHLIHALRAHCEPGQQQKPGLPLVTVLQAAAAACRQWTWAVDVLRPQNIFQHPLLAATVQPAVVLQVELLQLWQLMPWQSSTAASSSVTARVNHSQLTKTSANRRSTNGGSNNKKKARQTKTKTSNRAGSSSTSDISTDLATESAVLFDAVTDIASSVNCVAMALMRAISDAPCAQHLPQELLLLLCAGLAYQTQCLICHEALEESQAGLLCGSISSSRSQHVAAYKQLYAAAGLVGYENIAILAEHGWGTLNTTCILMQSLSQCFFEQARRLDASVLQLLLQLAMPLLHVVLGVPLLAPPVQQTCDVYGICFTAVLTLVQGLYIACCEQKSQQNPTQHMEATFTAFCQDIVSEIAPKVMSLSAPAVAQLVKTAAANKGLLKTMYHGDEARPVAVFAEGWGRMIGTLAAVPAMLGPAQSASVWCTAAEAFWQHPDACATALELAVRDRALQRSHLAAAVAAGHMNWMLHGIFKHLTSSTSASEQEATRAAPAAASGPATTAAPPLYALLLSFAKYCRLGLQVFSSTDARSGRCCNDSSADGGSSSSSTQYDAGSDSKRCSSAGEGTQDVHRMVHGLIVLNQCWTILNEPLTDGTSIACRSSSSTPDAADTSSTTAHHVEHTNADASWSSNTADDIFQTSSRSSNSRQQMMDGHAFTAVLAARLLLLATELVPHVPLHEDVPQHGIGDFVVACGTGLMMIAHHLVTLLDGSITAAADMNESLRQSLVQLSKQQQALLPRIRAFVKTRGKGSTMQSNSVTLALYATEDTVAAANTSAAKKAAQQEKVVKNNVAEIVAAVKQFALRLSAAQPLRFCCNNPTCTNLNGSSELLLAKAAGSRCSGCKQCFYCSKECQADHWPHHKHICKLLKANAT